MTPHALAACVVVKTARDDLLDLLDYAWRRLESRMAGLADVEWAWCPSESDPKVSIRWRLEHLATMLTEPHIATWLGSSSTFPADLPASASAKSARSVLSAAYASFRDMVGVVDLDQEIGQAAGRYGSATRHSFVLHVADELIHHGAEAALLRDLYSSSPPQ